MSVHEQKAFLTSIHPFEYLTPSQLDYLVENMDITYYQKDTLIQKNKDKPTHLYFVLKGLVQEKNNDEVLSVYSKNEFFEPISLIENYSKNDFITHEETICYTLPKKVFQKILHGNRNLESYFFQTISQKLNNHIAYEKNKDMANIMIAKVKDAKIHKAIILDEQKSIYEAVEILHKKKIPNVLIKDENKNYYIVTDSDFREKVILKKMDFDDKLIKIATKGVVCINENDFLFNAQLQMAKHGVKRVVVKNDKKDIVGILDQISLSSFFATNTFAVSNEIVQAASIEDLKNASLNFIKIIKSLNAKGVKIEFISKLINSLNKKLIDKLYKMLAPKGLYENSCLIVMGSEGRGEQVLKTDQDNALIIKDDFQISDEVLRKFTQEFTDTLIDFGFPKCMGNIMVSNPYWCKKQQDFKDLIYSWVNNPNEENIMNTAIFLDASSVNKKYDLVTDLKRYLFSVVSDNETFTSNFAKITSNFDVPLGFFEGFVFNSDDKDHKNEIDIKKGGIFIIVHSIRTWALKHNIYNTSTLKRIKKLKEQNVFDDELAQELTVAFNYLNNLRLKSNIEKLNAHEELDNFINPQNLDTMQKDLLKDAFKIINKLKKKLDYRFKLNYV
ncbi:MAG: putative nucleotidyltransferase substrate binding domain-containing protein [Sulfurovum sp.]